MAIVVLAHSAWLAAWASSSSHMSCYTQVFRYVSARRNRRSTQYTARSELSASDLVLREPFLLGIIAWHLSPLNL